MGILHHKITFLFDRRYEEFLLYFFYSICGNDYLVSYFSLTHQFGTIAILSSLVFIYAGRVLIFSLKVLVIISMPHEKIIESAKGVTLYRSVMLS